MNTLIKTLGAGIILGMGSANERRYIVTSSLIGWAHTQNDPCLSRTYSLLTLHQSIRIDKGVKC